MTYELPSPFQHVPHLDALPVEKYRLALQNAFRFHDATDVERAYGDPRVNALVEPLRRPSFNYRSSCVDARELDEFVDRVRTAGVGIAGAGLMGISIAAAFVNADFNVLSYDVVDAAREAAPARLATELAALRRNLGVALHDQTSEEDFIRQGIATRFQIVDDLQLIAAKDVVVESTPEKPRLKAKLYQRLDQSANAPILLFTNTSSLTITELAANLPDDAARRPTSRSRFAGFHFFHPATKRRPVEIAVGPSTADSTVARAVALVNALGKEPMVVGDANGFLVNRLLQAYLNEGLAALDEGVAPARVEEAATRFGMEGAPLRVVDEIGVDVALHSGFSFLKAFPTRTHESTILPELVREGRLGRKTSRGFYRYASRVSWADDATLEPLTVAKARSNVDERFQTPEALAMRAIVAIFFEACRLVEEGVAPSLQCCDAGLLWALGFPPEKGGACYWALSFGVDRLLRVASEFEPLGERFKAPELAVDLARRR